MPERIELLIPILAILFASIIILVPIAGLTLRFALKPAMEAYAKVREAQAPDLRALEQRVAVVEEQLRAVIRTQAEGADAQRTPGMRPEGLIAEPTTGPS